MFQTQAKHSSTNNQLGEQYTNTTATFIMQIGMKKNGGCSLAMLCCSRRRDSDLKLFFASLPVCLIKLNRKRLCTQQKRYKPLLLVLYP